MLQCKLHRIFSKLSSYWHLNTQSTNQVIQYQQSTTTFFHNPN